MADDTDGTPTEDQQSDRAAEGSARSRPVMTVLFIAAMVLPVAVIILPFIGGPSRGHGRRTACMGNLHQVAIAMKMYRQDTGGYPLDLRERPIPAGENWYGPDLSKTRPGYGVAALYPDYISNVRVFNCPKSDAHTLGTQGEGFTHQSYDGEDPAAGPGGNMADGDGRLYADGQFFGPGARLKYARVWKVRWKGNTASPDPEERRQLIWKDHPDETVVTWCPYHRRDPKAAQVRPDDHDLIVYVDGSTKSVRSLNESGHGSRPGEW